MVKPYVIKGETFGEPLELLSGSCPLKTQTKKGSGFSPVSSGVLLWAFISNGQMLRVGYFLPSVFVVGSAIFYLRSGIKAP